MNALATFNPLGWIDWPWWTPWALWGGAAVLVVIFLGAVKSFAGWPGVVAVLLFVVAVAAGAVGFKQGVEWADRRNPKGKPKDTPFKDIFGDIFGRR